MIGDKFKTARHQLLNNSDGTLRLGYGVYVKDSPGSSEWICFDCPSDPASLKKQGVLAVLDRIVRENGLSYTECCFERWKASYRRTKI